MSSRCMPNNTKLVHFYMLITPKHKKVVEKFVKKNYYGENTHLWGNYNVYQQHMLLKLRKPIWKYTFVKNHIH